MQARNAVATAGISALIVSAFASPSAWGGDDDKDEPPLRISIDAPNSGNFQGRVTPTGWALVLRIEAPDSVAIVESPEEKGPPRGRREAIVLTDPDGCIDMRHFPITPPIPDGGRAGLPYEDCAGPDETFLEFTTERFDTFDLADSNTGNFQVRDRLIDDAFADGVLLNKPYLRNTAGCVVAVPRPQTTMPQPPPPVPPGQQCAELLPDEFVDGFGFGPDDDLVGVVMMVDLGGARAFDEDFNRTQGRVIRNMAGFINSVSQELLTKRGGSAVTAWMQVIAGMFEPIAQFDLDVDDQSIDYLRRLESGPVQAFNYIGPAQSNDEKLREISSTYGTYDLDLRVVIVEGVAPTFIHDMNGDGRYTAADLRRMGYKVMSNEARLKLRLDFDVLVTETVTGRTCPPATLSYRDLDGNGGDGAIVCSGTGGAARVRRPPL